MAGMGKTKGENHTEWDFELWPELNGLADLIYALRCHVVQEALKMEDKNGWKHLDLHLLARLIRAGLADQRRLRL